MSDPGALDATRSACQQVIGGVPLDQVQAARARLTVALDEIIAAGSCRHVDYRAALDGLSAMLTDLDAIQRRLASAAHHARQLQARL